jgi:two-component system, OmpR family, response regulator CpxR
MAAVQKKIKNFRGMSLVPYSRPLVLCIDDDELALTIRKKVLETDGYKVIAVTDADEGLKIFREAPVCCTIADHLLKGKTGTETAKEMKKLKPNVPIILLSGSVPEKLENIDVYINKATSAGEFLRIVRDVTKRCFFVI